MKLKARHFILYHSEFAPLMIFGAVFILFPILDSHLLAKIGLKTDLFLYILLWIFGAIITGLGVIASVWENWYNEKLWGK